MAYKTPFRLNTRKRFLFVSYIDLYSQPFVNRTAIRYLHTDLGGGLSDGYVSFF